MSNQPKWFSRLLKEIEKSGWKSATGPEWFGFANNLAKKGGTTLGEINYLDLAGMLVPPDFDPEKRFSKDDLLSLESLIPRTQTLVLDQPRLSYDDNDRRKTLMARYNRGYPLSPSDMEFVQRVNEQASRSPLWGNAGYDTFPQWTSLRSLDGNNYREHLLWHPDAYPDDVHLDPNHYSDVGIYDPETMERGDQGLRQIGWSRLQDLENPLSRKMSDPTTNIEEAQANRHAFAKKLGYEYGPVLRDQGAGYSSPVGHAPFEKEWPALMFRNALWDAATRGHSGIGWAGPNTQAARWSDVGIGLNALDTYKKEFPKVAAQDLRRLGGDPSTIVNTTLNRPLSTDELYEAEQNFVPYFDDSNGGVWVDSFDSDPSAASTLGDRGFVPLDNRINDKIQEEGLPLFKNGGQVDLSPERFYRDRMANASGQHAFAGGGLAKRTPQAISGLLGAAGLGDLAHTLGQSEYPVLQRIFGPEDLDPRSSRAYINEMQSKYLSREPDPDDVFGAPGGGSILGHVADWAMQHPVDALDMVDPTGLVSSGLDMVDRYNYAGDYKGKESESSIADYPRILINNFGFGLPDLLSGMTSEMGLSMMPLDASSTRIRRPKEEPEPEPIEFEYGARPFAKGGTTRKKFMSILEELEDLLTHQRGRGVEITPEMEAKAREGVGAGLGAAYSLADAKGLDMSTEARMKRMAEQGYDNPAYHGTHYDPRLAPRGDFSHFADWLNEDPYNKMHSTVLGTHLAEDPTMANALADASSIAFKDKNALKADRLEEETTTNAFKNHYTDRERQELLDRIATLRATPAKFAPQEGYVIPLRFRGDFYDIKNDPMGVHPEASDDHSVKRDIFDFAMKGRGNHPGLGMDWFKEKIMKGRRSKPYNWKGGIGGQYIGPTNFFQKQGTSDFGYFSPDEVAGRDVVEAYRDYLRERGTPNLGYSNTEELEVDGGDPLSYIIPTPDDMRSPFAAFDPDNQGSGHILGGLAGLGMVGALSGGQEPEQKFSVGGTVKKQFKNVMAELEDLLFHQRGRGVEITPEIEQAAREGVGSGLGAAYSLADAKGLDMSTEARMQRMLEQGYDNPAYHGAHNQIPNDMTARGDFPQFADWLDEPEGEGRRHAILLGTHLAEDPLMASAHSGVSNDDLLPSNVRKLKDLERRHRRSLYEAKRYGETYPPEKRESVLSEIRALRNGPPGEIVWNGSTGFVMPLQFRGDLHDVPDRRLPDYDAFADNADDHSIAKEMFGRIPREAISKVYDSFTPEGRAFMENYRQRLINEGTPNLRYKNTSVDEYNDGGNTAYVVPNPDDMRSPFAAFDPDNQGSGHILGGLAGLGMVGALSGEQEPEKFTKGGSVAGKLIMEAWEAAKAAAKAAGEKPPKRPWGDKIYGTGVWADPPNLEPRPRGWKMPGTPWAGRGGPMLDHPLGLSGYTTPRPVPPGPLHAPGALDAVFGSIAEFPERGLLTMEEIARRYANAPRGAIHDIFDREDARKYVDYGLGDYEGGDDYE